MKSLYHLQEKFSHAILGRDPSAVLPDIMEDDIPASERYNIYRNNTFISLTQALSQNFPVLYRLVGQAFFDQMAQDYIRKFPPASPVLMEYGARLPVFLRDYPPVSAMPYFADVAGLEKLWNECFNGLDGQHFDLERLTEVTPESYCDLKIMLLPNLRLFNSNYPILEIWLSNQKDVGSATEITLDSGGCYVALYRREQQVEIMTLDPATYEFLCNLTVGQTLEQAAEDIMDRHLGFELQTALQMILQNGMMDDFSIRAQGDMENDNV